MDGPRGPPSAATASASACSTRPRTAPAGPASSRRWTATASSRPSPARLAAPAVPERPRDPARGDARRRGRGADGGGDVRDRGPAELVRRVVQDLRDAAAPPLPGRGRRRGRASRSRVTCPPVRRDRASRCATAAATVPGALPEEAQQHGAGGRAGRARRAASRGRRWGSGAPASWRSARRTSSACARSRLDHLRADLRLEAPGWEAGLERAVANARALDVPLELALFLPDDPRGGPAGPRRAAPRRCGRASPPGCSSGPPTGPPPTGDAALARDGARRGRPAARSGAGRTAHFAELNRRRPSAPRARPARVRPPTRRSTPSTTPPLVENVASLRSMADTARGFAGGAAARDLARHPARRAWTRARPRRATRASRRSPTTRGRRRRSRRPGRSRFLAAAAEAGFDEPHLLRAARARAG